MLSQLNNQYYWITYISIRIVHQIMNPFTGMLNLTYSIGKTIAPCRYIVLLILHMCSIVKIISSCYTTSSKTEKSNEHISTKIMLLLPN